MHFSKILGDRSDLVLVAIEKPSRLDHIEFASKVSVLA